MSSEPDLPSVSLSRKVTPLAEQKPIQGYPEPRLGERKQRRSAEVDFRKRLQDAIALLQEREAKHDLAFDLVELNGDLAVSITDATGESVGVMTGDHAIARAASGDDSAFFIDEEC